MYTDFTLEELEDMETLQEGYADDLKLEEDGYRVWLSRVGIKDGMTYNNMVTVEELQNGSWVTIYEYEAL